MEKIKLVSKILLESEEENLFKPRRLEGRPITKTDLYENILEELDKENFYQITIDKLFDKLEKQFQNHKLELQEEDLRKVMKLLVEQLTEDLEFNILTYFHSDTM